MWAVDRAPFDSNDLPSSVSTLIVGAGFSGLWTAIHLRIIAPDNDVVVVDAHEPGFGASGRNGGWCSGLFPVDLDDLARLHGAERARSMLRAMQSTVTDIEAFITEHSIECDWQRSGTLTIATNPSHLPRLKAQVDVAHRHGFTDHTLFNREQVERLVKVRDGTGGLYSPHCAVLHPLKLVNGLVRVARGLGVRIIGNARVRDIDRGSVVLDDGRRLGTSWTVRATEGFTPNLRGAHRAVIPLWSYMVATEPLPDHVWREIGWETRVAIADGRNMVTYAQRTADRRIAFGGRGVGYPFGSRISPRRDSSARVHDRIVATMHEMFPATRRASVTHQWGGPLAVPRDWHPAVNMDAGARLITLGGYSGDGVAGTFLAGRTAAAMIAGTNDEMLSLPWVDHHSPNWEPEPFRWLGINTLSRLPEVADSIERRTKKPARRTLALFDRLA